MAKEISQEYTKIEYRIRPVTRWYVSRFHQQTDGGGAEAKGEFDSAQVAYEVGYALCKAEHDALGWPPGDERIQYPRQPDENMAAFVAWLSNRTPEELFQAEDPKAFWADIVYKAQRCAGAA
ncbi:MULTISPECIES: hypothetical protein [Hyphobacterium]|uniref:Uncharacterized protein n=1 Tax=Hyphobacterium vulgare TaxID=1736751 RepID=A0ABV6ZUB3_9PROT